ncbi:MAG: 4Fe-4S dicluster domain-containing protein [Pseudomonadota bacterium]
MPRENPYRPFTPHPDLMARAPEVSGNEINGLGETAKRPPEVVYWSPDTSAIPHGRMQEWFYTRDPDDPHITRARAERIEILSAEVPEIEGEPVQRSEEEWAKALAAYAETGDFEMIGVTEMRDDYLMAGRETEFTRVIMIGVAHDYAEIATAPETRAGAEVLKQYGRAGAAAKALAGWLRLQGWPADPVTGPFSSEITMIPPAIDAGFGELGKHGSIISAEHGASFRLAAVLTDAPIPATPRRDHGIDGFCRNCRICEDACPPEALAPEKQTVRGVEKWYVDFDKCLPFFNEHQGCSICIAVCPWSRPGVGLNLAAKLAKRRERLAE